MREYVILEEIATDVQRKLSEFNYRDVFYVERRIYNGPDGDRLVLHIDENKDRSKNSIIRRVEVPLSKVLEARDILIGSAEELLAIERVLERKVKWI